MINLEITIDNLKQVKSEIYNKKISDDEKNNIVNKIYEEVEKILNDFDKKEEIEIDE